MSSSRTPSAPGLLAATLLLVAAPSEATAQLPTASAAALGVGDNYSAAALGFAALGANPARLGMPDRPSWSLSLPAVSLRPGAHPVGLGDINEYSGEFVPAAQREAWLLEIAANGGQTGSGRLAVTPFAASIGSVGLQVTTMGLASTNLNEDAAELLLFGNAGRTGEPRDFQLGGSSVDVAAFTTMAVGFGIPVTTDRGVWSGGAAFTVAVGHALVTGRDAGSLLSGDPVLVEIEFPILQTDTAFQQLNNGFGFGLDVGAAYEEGALALSAAVKNIVNVFEWDTGSLFYRPGQALFDGDMSDSDFDARPGREAPAALLAEVRDQAFDRRIELAAAYRWREGVRLFGEVRRRFGDGLNVSARNHLGAGAEVSLMVVKLRAGGALLSGGYQMGGGVGLGLGPVHVNGGLLKMGGDAGEGVALAFTLSYGAY